MKKNEMRETLETVREREREREREYLAKICFVNHAKKSIKEEEIGYVDRYKSYV